MHYSLSVSMYIPFSFYTVTHGGDTNRFGGRGAERVRGSTEEFGRRGGEIEGQDTW
jgi:hypothetical protein